MSVSCAKSDHVSLDAWDEERDFSVLARHAPGAHSRRALHNSASKMDNTLKWGHQRFVRMRNLKNPNQFYLQ